VRAVSKRLLVRFKGRAPPPLGRLDALAAHSARAARAAARRVAARQQQLAAANNRLACSVGLLHLLACLRFGLARAAADELARWLLAPPGRGAAPLDSLEETGGGGGAGPHEAAGGAPFMWVAPHAGDAHLQPGWQELADARLAHALRTALAWPPAARSSGQPHPKPKPSASAAALAAAGAGVPVMPADCAKLRRHLTLVCERLRKGATLAY
jgi:hypothetical protein